VKDDQLRALLIVGALLSGASATSGFVGGRMSVADPPAEVRLIRLPPRVIRIPMAEAAPAEPGTVAPAPSASFTPAPADEPPAIAPPAPVETRPLPLPRPKLEAKPKPQPKPLKHEKDAPAKKPRPPVPSKKALPSCAVVQREYDAMSWPERMAAYRSATAEEIAHGKRCLGL